MQAMHGMIDVICMIDEALKDRKLPPMRPLYGAWKLSGKVLVRLNGEGNLEVAEESEGWPTNILSTLSLPAHSRYARSFAQDVAELAPSVTP